MNGTVKEKAAAGKSSNRSIFNANMARPEGFEPPTTWFVGSL